MHNPFSDPFEHYQQQQGRLLSLIERLLTLVETLHNPALLRELQHIRNLLTAQMLKILVAGELNAGKSTIINALLRAKVLPAYPVPTTALLTRVKRGTQPEVFLHRHPSHDERQQSPLKVALTEMEPYLVFNENNEQNDDFEEAEVFLPLPPIYDDIEFIDVIGPYDDDGYDESLVKYTPSADVILYTIRCDRPASQEEALRIDWIRSMGNAALLFLCNRFDLVEPRSQNRIRQTHLSYLGQLSGADSIFFTSAKGALEGYLRGDMLQVAQSAMPQMEEVLYHSLAIRGKQNLQSILVEVHSLLRLSQQIVLLRMKFQHSALQGDALAQLHHECEWIEKERRRVDNAFNTIRRRITDETKPAAAEFYRECSNTLDSLAQGFIPQQPHTTWEAFNGDALERLAKQAIAFLTQTIQHRFQTWISFTLESLLQDELKSGSSGLAQDAPARIAQAVMRRVNRSWHPSILIKRVIEYARLHSYLEPGIDFEQVNASIVSLYRRTLDTSADMLVETITGTIDDELRQRQQTLTHRLDLQFQCWKDAARPQLEEKRKQEQRLAATIMPLLIALEDELAAIELEVGTL